jgi:DNA-directed RNA polymerase subunit RPC12/RpoP
MECTLTEPFEALMYEYLCSACGSFCDVEAVYGADEEMPHYCPNCGRKVTKWK